MEGAVTKGFPLTSRCEVWGGSLLGVAHGLEGAGVSWDQVLSLLAASGIQQPEAEGWYPLKGHLAFLAKAEAAHGREALRAMGRAIPDTSRFPPELENMERALGLLDVAYQVNHRGGPIGRYHLRHFEPGRAEICCENPYPCDVDLGILERLVERFGQGGPTRSVVHRPGPECRCQGAQSCLFDLRW
jgi:hypothetical protein